MKYCSPRARLNPAFRATNTPHTHTQSHSQNSKTVPVCFKEKFCCDFERNTLKEIIVTEILKPARVILTSNQTIERDETLLSELPELSV